MKKIWKPLKVISINFLLLFLLLEGGSIALYFHHTGRFFYSTKKGEAKTNGQQSESASFDDRGPASLKRILHPYLGFVYDQRARRSLPFSSIEYAPNNLGILSPYDYPLKKTSNDQFIVGIFGGSVAMYYAFYELENHALANALKQLPYLQSKQIIVLPFASGSYKQPQQLLELNYLLSLGQDFDLVINIDGFNETALAYLNNKSGFESSMPSVEMFGPLVELANRSFSTQDLTLTLEILKLKEAVSAAHDELEKCRFATCHTLRWIQLRYLSRQYQQKSEAFDRLTRNKNESDSLVHVTKHDKPLEDAVAVPEMVGLWARSELSMSQLLAAKRVPYFPVLQTNQYYATGRKFSEAEQKIAFNFSSVYAEAVIKGYPKLIAEIDELEKSGVKVVNAVNAFDASQDPVYVDSCCHYNQTGNDLFAKFVAGQIVKSLKAETTVR